LALKLMMRMRGPVRGFIDHSNAAGGCQRWPYHPGMVLSPDALPAVTVQPVTPALADAVRALQVAPGQADYVGDTAFNFAQAQADPLSEAMAILAGDTVAGFYRLDFAPNAVAGRGFGAPSVGLRAFMLDRAWQGRGLGARATAALCADLQRRHPRRRLLVLTVNCRNTAAIAAYRRAGCIDTGELFRGGRAGPQHLMLRALGDGGVGQ
jgi:RimJ/RimL family protein N-acetyltransferase